MNTKQTKEVATIKLRQALHKQEKATRDLEIIRGIKQRLLGNPIGKTSG